MKRKFNPLPWVHHTNIYEVNLRQYTAEGTFKAFAKHLPRLQKMGVEVLWFMPITPIGIPHRLGTLGSYYACSSYTKTNPEFGTLADFNLLVKSAHELGMKVIIDWVANHTGYGHDWMETHPEFYERDAAGEYREKNGWTDVVDLDFNNAAMRQEMIAAMKFWVSESDIDGFRCDMAHLVPLDFWMQARQALDAVKPLFWLAECEVPAYHDAFDASYAWEWMHETGLFAKAAKTLTVLDKVLYRYHDDYPVNALKLFFTTNHDENSWNGTEFEKYGEMAPLFAIFSTTWNGLPLIYSGQEIPNKRRLKFFDKDPLIWPKQLSNDVFYNRLLHLRKRNSALSGGSKEALTYRLSVSNERVMGYLRRNGQQEVLVLLNFNDHASPFYLQDHRVHARFKDIFDEQVRDFNSNRFIELPAYGYLVLEKILA